MTKEPESSDLRRDEAGTTARDGSHDEWLLDESIEETFPASDPASSVLPGSTLGVRYATHGATAAPDRRRSRRE
jgi:hypothetical protein